MHDELYSEYVYRAWVTVTRPKEPEWDVVVGGTLYHETLWSLYVFDFSLNDALELVRGTAALAKLNVEYHERAEEAPQAGPNARFEDVFVRVFGLHGGQGGVSYADLKFGSGYGVDAYTHADSRRDAVLMAVDAMVRLVPNAFNDT